MPLYFPRTKEEESYAAKALPADLGDEFGEPTIQERKIRIADNPLTNGTTYIAMVLLSKVIIVMEKSWNDCY